jgi:hypothetical protein
VDDSVDLSTRSFKVCTMCGKEWRSREDFLVDQEIKAIGYMAHFRELKFGLFYFNHETCRTTITIAASRFTDLYGGPVFEERLTGTSDCPGYCLRQDELRPCPVKCECAYVREVLDRVIHWEKIR